LFLETLAMATSSAECFTHALCSAAHDGGVDRLVAEIWAGEVVTELITQYSHDPVEVRSRVVHILDMLVTGYAPDVVNQSPVDLARNQHEQDALFLTESERMNAQVAPETLDASAVLGVQQTESNDHCPNERCESTNVSKELRQVRGGDEGMTVFYSCDECGKVWRI
jgi:DNA-directed RNA polymerase subunit M/transcription elongation factor TFIIS